MIDLPSEPPAIIQLAGVSQSRCDQPSREDNYIYHYIYDYCYRLSYEKPDRDDNNKKPVFFSEVVNFENTHNLSQT
jgi:hypothetical protein